MTQIPQTMKAAFLTGRMQIEVREILPQQFQGEEHFKVEACGLCGSDINRIKFTESDEQRVIGHEVAGVVVTTDDDSNPFVPGDKIAVAHVHIPCGYCYYCRHGSPCYVSPVQKTRIIPGGYSEYIALSPDHLAHTCIRIPEGVSFAEATFLDPAGCCLRGLGQIKAKPLIISLSLALALWGSSSSNS